MGATLRIRNSWKRKLSELENNGLPDLPPKKVFKAKHSLPVLSDYSKPAPADYWDKFPKNINSHAQSLVNPEKLEHLARFYGYKDEKTLMKVIRWLREGAKIGCVGEFRNPSTAKNSVSAVKEGEKISDAIADWLKKGFARGPVPLDKVQGKVKLNSLMTRPKPNGSVRIILNLSSPKGESVNDGICADDFPATMSSTTQWLRILKKAGRGCVIMKCDWADAYKHCHVHPEDLSLQWFSWLGMAFCELCLVFGSASSAGIFDALAKVVLFIVIKRANFPQDMVIQHLDDVVAAAPANSQLLENFDKAFIEVADVLGVKLASREDPEKSFAPTHQGTVLGIKYDTQAWVWGLSDEKLARITNDIEQILLAEYAQQDEIWSIAGKIINVKPLVPGGKYMIDHIIRHNNFSEERSAMIKLEPGFKAQLRFWQKILPLCSGNIKIPDPDVQLPPWAIECFSDAAGGSWTNPGQGVGALDMNGWWVYLPWSKNINTGKLSITGKRLDRAMSVLELMGPLLVIAAGYIFCKNAAVKVYVDNQASVNIWKKGYSYNCKLSTTLVKAIHTVSVGLQCNFSVEKITRCSNAHAYMADCLSKARFDKFWRKAKEIDLDMDLDMAWIPKSILKWSVNPTEDDYLGQKILKELALRTPVLSYNC